MKNMFVSYAHPDIGVVRQVVRLLKDAGVRVWFDKDELLGGQDWEREISAQIRKCDLFLVCLSSRSIDRRGYFHKEIRIALDVAMTIPPAQLYMIPIRLDACEIPSELQRYHVLDLYTENGAVMLFKSIEFACSTSICDKAKAAADIAKVATQAVEQPATALSDTNLSDAAKSLLRAILADNRSATKGVSFMLLSETQGSHVPYLWDNHVHGALNVKVTDIATERLAADELVENGLLRAFPQSNQLKKYALKPGVRIPSLD